MHVFMHELLWLVSCARSEVKFYLYSTVQDKYPKVLQNNTSGTYKQKVTPKNKFKKMKLLF